MAAGGEDPMEKGEGKESAEESERLVERGTGGFVALGGDILPPLLTAYDTIKLA